ncbi:hypothetical protein T484DRAFT_2025921 [Baffinella frigidus]|nr:hypothetical protein T484DRAFT_2025921 [Cryptophyta sp. CCMP2293]
MIRRNSCVKDVCELSDPATMPVRHDGTCGEEGGRHHPVIPGRLSLAIYPDACSLELASQTMRHLVFYTSREERGYRSYCADFGPVDLATTVSYCIRTRNLMKDERYKDSTFVHGTSPNP